MRKVLIAMVVAVLAAATVARADAKIAVVDVQRVIDDSEKGKQARELLKQKFEQEKAALEKEGKEISVLKEDLDKQAPVLTPEKREEREQDLRQRIKDFNRLKKDKQDEFNAKQMEGAIDKANEIVASDPARYFLPQQFTNSANPQIHEDTTGPEIWEDTEGKVDVFISGVGTGGTITGVSRYIKNTKGKPILSVAVEPAQSPVISQTLRGEPLTPGPHKIQGIGAGFIPDVLDLSLVDRVESVTNDESIEFARRLAREEGILCGISCGAAAAVAVRLARSPEYEGKTIVAILPDAGERYLTTALFEGWLDASQIQMAN